MLVLSCCPLWETKIRVKMHSNANIPLRTQTPIFHCIQNKVLQNAGLKWHYGKKNFFGDVWGHYTWYIFVFLSTKCFYLLLLLIFFLFQIKTSGFHLKEEGKELLGMLMAALANNNGYYVLYLFSFVLFK